MTLARALGIDPALAPCLYALAWGLIALSLFYVLILRVTGRIGVAAVWTLLLGLTRAVWTYNVIAKAYSMSLAFDVALLALALWPDFPPSGAF